MTQPHVVCPKCGAPDPEKVGYAWWGGALGPRLFNHVKCVNCGSAYNGWTGRSNQGAIATYLIVTAVVAIAFWYFVVRG